MSNKEIEAISRSTYRRMRRRERERGIRAAKILLLWIFCFAAVTGFVFATGVAFPDSPILKWVLRISATYILVHEIHEIAERMR